MPRRDKTDYKVKGYSFGLGGYSSYKKRRDSPFYIGIGRKRSVKAKNYELLKAYTTDTKKLRKRERMRIANVLKIRRE
jgi:hypothetical protein